MNSLKMRMALGFTLISLIWGSTWLAIKLGLESVPPFYGVALRFSVALAVLTMIVRIRRIELPSDRNSIALYMTLGILSFSVPFSLVYWGEQHVASSLASILFGVYPFIVATLSHWLLPNEKLTLYKLVGVTLGFLGVLVIFWGDIGLGRASILGMVAIVVSASMQATSLVIVKKLGKDIDHVAMNFGGMLVSVPISYACAFALENFSAIRFDANGIGSILYLGTFGTVVTFLTYYWLLKHVEAVYMSLIAFVTPVLAMAFGALWLGERLTPGIVVGAVFVLLGILIANGRDLLNSVRQNSTTVFGEREQE
jgi:drug/metabolite transporter (DMT)-like permease